jgi:hypothetical protein
MINRNIIKKLARAGDGEPSRLESQPLTLDVNNAQRYYLAHD